MTNWKTWWHKWQGSELLPIIPPDAPLKEGSTVKPETRGKVPGVRNDDGTWSGLGGKWSAPSFAPTVKDVHRWYTWKAGIGMQGRVFPAIDVDVNDPVLADAIEKLAFDILGPAPTRGRDGSARRLLMYRLKDGETPFKKRRVAWTKA